MKPEYCENVIIGVMYKRKFNWYLTHKLLWRMDYRKEYKMWEEWYAGQERTKKRFDHEVGSFEDFCKRRWGIAVLNEKSAESFFKHIERHSVSVDELSSLYSNAEDEDEEISLIPVFYVDFDKKHFYSYFPEPENYEDFVPDGWSGEYCCFDSFIPKDKVYWSRSM